MTGTFSGDLAEEVTAATDSNGQAVLTATTDVDGRLKFTFCVDVDGVLDVLNGLPYDSAANVETCDSK